MVDKSIAARTAIDPHISIATVYRTVRLFEDAAFSSVTISSTADRATRRARDITTHLIDSRAARDRVQRKDYRDLLRGWLRAPRL